MNDSSERAIESEILHSFICVSILNFTQINWH